MAKHRRDLLSLTAGLSFLTVSLLYLLGDVDNLRLDARPLGPALLICVGLIGLARSARRRRAPVQPFGPKDFGSGPAEPTP